MTVFKVSIMAYLDKGSNLWLNTPFPVSLSLKKILIFRTASKKTVLS
jgi:hypothetical protein